MKRFLINEKIKIGVALKRFDKLGGKTLYVIQNNNLLVGSLTDGDWRRESLKGRNINNTVQKICNKNPIKIYNETANSQIKKLFLKHNLHSIPVVNKKNILVKIILKKQFLKKRIRYSKKNSIPVIIMAGGKGSRLSPFTKVLPKPLIPIKGKTIISRIVENFILTGFSKFFISINEKSKIIKSYFEEKNFKRKISFLEEKKRLGTVGALSKLKNNKEKNFIVTNCDTIIKYDFIKIYKSHLKNRNSLTVVAVKKKYSIPFGVIEQNNKKNQFYLNEKPELKYLINSGCYIINKRAIKLIKKNKFCDFDTFVNILRKKDEKIGIYQISEKKWQDTGTWEEYRKTVALMS